MYTFLKNPMKHSSVKTLKKLLNEKIGSSLDVNNDNFGPSTEAEVKRFQKKVGLIQDGLVGDLTWEALNNRLTSSCLEHNSSFLSQVILIMASQVGVKETTGKNDGPEVKKYLASVGLPEGYAWCQAILYWAFDLTAKTLSVKNPMPKTAGVLDNWRKSAAFQVPKGSGPKSGDVFTMDFGKGQGHAGIVTDVLDGYIHTIEGNTSADPTLPSEDREGQGVYRRRRKISSINNGFIRYTVPV